MMKVCPKNKSRILKRLCSFVLAVIFCVPMCALPLPAHAAKSITLPDTLTPEMAAAFANQLSKTESSNGGTLYAVIETLGPDKYPILRIIEDNEYMSQESIWLFSGGKLENVYNNIANGGDEDDGKFFISNTDGIDYYGFCHYGGDYYVRWEQTYREYEIYTVESGRWKSKIQFSGEWTSNMDLDLGELINTNTAFFVTENGSEKSISETEYDQYFNKYVGSFDRCKNVNGAYLASALNSWGVSDKNELLTATDLAYALQSFGMSSKYGLEDVSSILTDELSTYFNDLTSFVFFKQGSNFSEFDSAMADNEKLFGMAEYLLDSGIIEAESDVNNKYIGEVLVVDDGEGGPGESIFPYEMTAGLRSVSCDTVNRLVEHFTGRTIDFVPYQVDHIPVGNEILQQVADNYVVSFIYDNTFYQVYSEATYLMQSADIQRLYKIDDNMFWGVFSVSWEDPYAGYTVLGEVSAIYSKVNDDYRLIKIYPLNESPSVEEILQYAINVNPESNFKIDYSMAANYTDLSQYVEALKSALSAVDTLNDAGNRAVTDYIDYVIQNHAPVAIYANENTVVISPETVKAAQEPAKEAKTVLMDTLDGLTLSRTPTLTARIDVSGLDLANPVRVRLPEDVIAAVGDLDAITLVLSDNQHMVTIPADGLRQTGYLDVQLEQVGQDQYSISFFDQSDNVIEHLETNITFTLPASSELSSVQAVCAGYSDNWGGQYDSQNRTLTFQTPYTGEYTILSNTVEIPDIDYLSDEMQRAITFMVTKGYFELDSEGRFNPNVGLNRYEFTQALVKIFFALNREAVTSFPDVMADNPYYPFVASGEENEILSGYDDGLFHGDDDILRVQMLAICGRTLVNKKGYSRPEDPSVYLNYVDSASIPEWSASDLALTVREGLIENGSALRPNQPINRGEAALILYRLFMLLYEVLPTPITIVEAQLVETSPEIASSGSISPVVIGGIVAVGIGAAGGVAYFFLGKRKGISRKS